MRNYVLVSSKVSSRGVKDYGQHFFNFLVLSIYYKYIMQGDSEVIKQEPLLALALKNALTPP